jgi:predicted anti-sigma-YlaC factor YlaD
MPVTGEECWWIENHIESYLDGDVNPEESEEFERHIKNCERCRRELSLARSILNQIRSLPLQSCPKKVVDEAASKVVADELAVEGNRPERLHKVLASIFTYAKKPVTILLLIGTVLVAAVVVQHQHTFTTGTVETQASVEVSREDLESAKISSMLALAYLNRYSKHTCDIIKQKSVPSSMIKKLRRSIFSSMTLFPINKEEKIP